MSSNQWLVTWKEAKIDYKVHEEQKGGLICYTACYKFSNSSSLILFLSYWLTLISYYFSTPLQRNLFAHYLTTRGTDDDAQHAVVVRIHSWVLNIKRRFLWHVLCNEGHQNSGNKVSNKVFIGLWRKHNRYLWHRCSHIEFMVIVQRN